MALVFAGTYVLDDDSWMAFLLLVPGFLILKSMGMPRADPHESEVRSGARGETQPRVTRRIGRVTRVGAVFVALSLPAAALIEALDLNDLTMWLVLVPVLLIGSLADREYFGWTDPADDVKRPSTS